MEDPALTPPKPDSSSAFDCNICMEQAKDPVVTMCGHLYCWPCLFKWMQVQAGIHSCPVCKAGLEANSVIPIYGKGCERKDPRKQPVVPTQGDIIPRRPTAQRPLPFERVVNHDGSISVQPAFGIIPTLLGYQNTQGGPGHREPLTPEQQHQAFLSRLLLLIGSFVIMCLLLF